MHEEKETKPYTQNVPKLHDLLYVKYKLWGLKYFNTSIFIDTHPACRVWQSLYNLFCTGLVNLKVCRSWVVQASVLRFILL